MNTPPRIWFAGTPEFAATALQALIEHPDYHITGILTQPDRPAGRGRKPQCSAVKTTGIAHNIPIAQPETLRNRITLFADQTPPDLIIVAAYGLLLPEWFLNYPKHGCINIHASLLPRWRGAAPIQRAIEAGDTETGISIMQMDKGLDTGAIWLSKRAAIHPNDNAGTLHDRLQTLGAEALIEALPLILQQTTTPEAQNNDHATYAHKLSKAEARIDWHQPIDLILRRIRAFNPFPVAHTDLDGTTLRLYEGERIDGHSDAAAGTIIAHHQHGLDIACNDGILRIKTMQLPGKTIANAADLRHGQNLNHRQCH